MKDDPNPGIDSDGLDSQPHTGLSDPSCSLLSETYCSQCQNVFELDQFAWSDTGELLSDYIRRWRKESKRRAGFLGTLLGVVATVFTMCAIGFVVGLAFGGQLLFNLGLGVIFGLIGFYFRSVFIRRRFFQSIGISDVRQLI